VAVVSLTGAVEGPVDEVILRAVVESAGRAIETVYVAEGKPNLLRRLSGFNAAARFAPWIVVVDLNGASCAPEFCVEHLPVPSVGMLFRVAVRAAEAWILGDTNRLASFLGVPRSRIPPNPDAEADPKQTLVNIARHSRRRAIREDMVPSSASGRRVGRAYEARLIEFVSDTAGWRPEVAAERSASLRRCIAALQS
jgi:hypothetical protein